MQELRIIVDLAHSSQAVVRDVLTITEAPVIISHTGFKGECNSHRNINDDLMKQIAATGGIIGVGYWDPAICVADVEHVVSAIIYGIQLVGEDHISLGGDFDGAVTTAIDTSQMVLLTDGLAKAGIDSSVIRKVMGGNVLRFLLENLPG